MSLPLSLRILGWVRRVFEFFMTLCSSFSLSKTEANSVESIDPDRRDEQFDDSLLLLSATELSRRIRERRVTSQKAVATFIQRIRKVNGHLNAMVLDTFDNAMNEARDADRKLDDGSAPSVQQCPLFGVPFTCKECFAVKGLPNTAGMLRRRSAAADEDAPVVRRIRAAGAILLGVSNVSELCLWFECHNKVYGRSKNPYNLGCTPGGSSGGEASLIGAGASIIGVGSDVGGSIRMPSFFCGVFGHKPSAGLVPNDGQFPCATSARSRKMLTTGPICRYADDLELMLKIMATGPDDVECLESRVDGFSAKEQVFVPDMEDSSLVVATDDASDSNAGVGISLQRAASHYLVSPDQLSARSDWPLMHAAAVAGLCNDKAATIDLSSLSYVSIAGGYTSSPILQSPLCDELIDVQRKVAECLSQNLGVEIKEASVQKMKHTADAWSVGMGDLGGADMTELLYSLPTGRAAGAWPSLKELMKWCVGMSEHTWIAIITALLDSQVPNLPKSKLDKMRSIRKVLESELEELIGENGILLFPSHATLAPFHNYPLLTPMNYAFTAIFNLTGMPVTQCPLGLASDGRPLGIQVVSLPGNDRVTIAVARYLQKSFGGWTPPGSSR